MQLDVFWIKNHICFYIYIPKCQPFSSYKDLKSLPQNFRSELKYARGFAHTSTASSKVNPATRNHGLNGYRGKQWYVCCFSTNLAHFFLNWLQRAALTNQIKCKTHFIKHQPWIWGSRDDLEQNDTKINGIVEENSDMSVVSQPI